MDASLVTNTPNTPNESMKTALESLMKTATPEGKLTQYIGLEVGCDDCFVAKNIDFEDYEVGLCSLMIMTIVLAPFALAYLGVCQLNKWLDGKNAKNLAAKSFAEKGNITDFGIAIETWNKVKMKAVRDYAKSELGLAFWHLLVGDGRENDSTRLLESLGAK